VLTISIIYIQCALDTLKIVDMSRKLNLWIILLQTLFILGCGSLLADVVNRQDLHTIAASSISVPSEYRRLAAKVILERTNFRIRDAQISTLSEMWAGILHGGTLPGVCVVIIRDNVFGQTGRDIWQITFKDGKIATAGYVNMDCGNTSKFNEVLAR